jgi:hypothetical protein
MSLCPQSGDIDHFLQLSTVDSVIYQQIRSDWAHLKQIGAGAGYMKVYTNKVANCPGIFATGSASDPSLKVLASLVVQFKDEKGAKGGFSQAGAFGVGAFTSGPGVTQGAATGLGDNSMVVSQTFLDQGLYFAYWQNHAFDVVVLGLNYPAADAKKATANVNGRIH